VAAPDFRPGLEHLRVGDLADMPLVSTPRSHLRREMVDRQLSAHGVRAGNIIIELGHPEAMKHAAEAGLGACLLFRAAVERELRDGRLVEIALDDASLTVPVYMVSRLTKALTPVQNAIVDAVCQHFEAGVPVAPVDAPAS
jgi:DNA-binding transcriptional LysR family regulator